MKNLMYCIILLFFIAIQYSCVIDVGNGDDGDGETNNPPVPQNIYPANFATGISLTPQLCWSCEGINNYNVRFDVYLDTYNPPNAIITSNTYNFDYTITTPLEENKTYYWKLKAMNDKGETMSEVWTFTTTTGGLPTAGLIAFYPFTGNTEDSSSYGNHGYNNGAELTLDRFYRSNMAYSFNGTSSYINVLNNSYLQPTAGLTLSAWIKPGYQLNTGSLLSKGSESSAGMYSLKYQSANSRVEFQINFSGNIQGRLSSGRALTANEWYNVIGTYDGNNMMLYINGVFDNSYYISGALGSNNEAMQIGSCPEGYFLDGSLDDIRIYNRALSNNEVLQLYHEGGWTKK